MESEKAIYNIENQKDDSILDLVRVKKHSSQMVNSNLSGGWF